MTHAKTVTAIIIASWIVIGSGLLMFLALFTPLSGTLDMFTDLAFYPLDTGQAVNGEVARLFNAITGGVLVGWGVMTLLVAKHVFAHNAAAGRAIILPSILAWFAIDSTGSVMAGSWFNVVLNLSFLIIFAVPILAMKADSRSDG